MQLDCDTVYMHVSDVFKQDRDILDSIDGSSQPSDNLATILAGQKSQERHGPCTGHSPSGRHRSTTTSNVDTRHRSSVWHFNFTPSPEFVLRPVDIGSSTPSPRHSSHFH